MSDRQPFDIEHFPTSKTAIRMMSRISPIYDKSYVGKWIFQVMGAEMDVVRLRFDELRDQAFPETATWGLPYWEQRYAIIPPDGATIEERRRAIRAKRGAREPMNPAKLERYIETLTGAPARIIEDVDPYTFQVDITTGEYAVDLRALYEYIRRIKPSHQAIQLTTSHETMEDTIRLAGAMMIYSTTILPELPEVHAFDEMAHYGGAAGEFSETRLTELPETHAFSGAARYAGGAQRFSSTPLPEMAERHRLATEARTAGAHQIIGTTPLPEYDAAAVRPLTTKAGVTGAAAVITYTALPEI